MARERIGQRAHPRVVDADRDGREVPRRRIGQRPPGERQRGTRLQTRLHVSPQRVARQRRMGQRLVTVPRHVPQHDRDPAFFEREHVIEVAPRGGSLGRSVGDRDLRALPSRAGTSGTSAACIAPTSRSSVTR